MLPSLMQGINTRTPLMRYSFLLHNITTIYLIIFTAVSQVCILIRDDGCIASTHLFGVFNIKAHLGNEQIKAPTAIKRR